MKRKIVNCILILCAFLTCFCLVGCDLSNPDTKTEEQIELESLVTDVRELESISKNYNESNFTKRSLIYVRCKKYNTSYWNMIGGSLENDFESYVENQFTKNLSYLQQKDFFTDTATKQNIDFVHCFATMNLEIQNSTLGDLGGFGGDLCQLVKEISDLNIEDLELLKQTAKDKFCGQSTFGIEDLLADIDAVNIIRAYNNLNGNNKTISNSMLTYYTNLTQEKRLNTFCNNLFGDKINLSLNEKCEYLYTRLKDNFFINYWNNNNGINFDDNQTEFEICIKLFVSYICNAN